MNITVNPHSNLIPGEQFHCFITDGKSELGEVKSFANHVSTDEQSQNFNLDLINRQILQEECY